MILVFKVEGESLAVRRRCQQEQQFLRAEPGKNHCYFEEQAP